MHDGTSPEMHRKYPESRVWENSHVKRKQECRSYKAIIVACVKAAVHESIGGSAASNVLRVPEVS